jgi:hypothetical protein
MRAVILLSLATALALLPAQASNPAHVRLHPGQRITLHVGQVADLEIPSGHPYSVDLNGDSVVPADPGKPATDHGKPTTKTRSYRAVHPGNATLLITPAEQKPGSCVDCVTRHCFVTVVP